MKTQLLFITTAFFATLAASTGKEARLTPGNQTVDIPPGWKVHEMHRINDSHWVLTAGNPNHYDTGIRIQKVAPGPESETKITDILEGYAKSAKETGEVVEDTTTEKGNGEEVRKIEVVGDKYHCLYIITFNKTANYSTVVLCGSLLKEWDSLKETFTAFQKLPTEKIDEQFPGEEKPVVYFTMEKEGIEHISSAYKERFGIDMQPRTRDAEESNKNARILNMDLPDGYTNGDGTPFTGNLFMLGICNKEGRIIKPVVGINEGREKEVPDEITNEIIRNWRIEAGKIEGQPVNEVVQIGFSYGKKNYDTANFVLFQQESDLRKAAEGNTTMLEDLSAYLKKVSALTEKIHQNDNGKETIFVNIIVQPGKKAKIWVDNDDHDDKSILEQRLLQIEPPDFKVPVAVGFVGHVLGGVAPFSDDKLGITAAWKTAGVTGEPLDFATIQKVWDSKP